MGSTTHWEITTRPIRTEDDLTATDIGHIKTAVLNRMGTPGTPTIVSNIVVQGNSRLVFWQSGPAGLLVPIHYAGGWKAVTAIGGWPDAAQLAEDANFPVGTSQILLDRYQQKFW